MHTDPESRRKNLSLATNLIMVVLGMIALSYASVPLYRMFCQVTGYGGTPKIEARGHAPGSVTNRKVTIAFNADVDPQLPWKFIPGQNQMEVNVGQQALTHFVAENLTDKPLTGRAAYNILPLTAGSYFVKIACFCFKQQTLQPHQKVNMPVVFYVDPAFLKDPEMDGVSTITLSYTFFPVKTENKPSSTQ